MEKRAASRSILIHPDLKEWTDIILRASSPDEPEAIEAKKRIRAMANSATPYLFASEIRAYLEETTRIGTERWAFPVAGDLFLDALDISLSSLGPNLFQDHYSGMAGCYRAGDCLDKVIQGAFYCVDLLLQRSLELVLSKDAQEKAEDGPHLSFLATEDPNERRGVVPFLKLARQCLQDAIEAAFGMGAGNGSRTFMDFVIDHKDRQKTVLDRWDAYHKKPELPEMTGEEYLEGAAKLAEDIPYFPLIATIAEYRVLLREQMGLRVAGQDNLEEEVHPLFHAASMYVALGNENRDADAYDIAFRRYSKADDLFTKIQDRTSTAKVCVERARAFIKSGRDPESVREELHKAVCLVMAHIKNMKRGAIANVKDDVAIKFLRNKGYLIEADAYAATLARAQENASR